MEEVLLPRSTIVEASPNGNVGEMPPSGALATPLLVLSTGVALCGSLCIGCTVSTIILLSNATRTNFSHIETIVYEFFSSMFSGDFIFFLDLQIHNISIRDWLNNYLLVILLVCGRLGVYNYMVKSSFLWLNYYRILWLRESTINTYDIFSFNSEF